MQSLATYLQGQMERARANGIAEPTVLLAMEQRADRLVAIARVTLSETKKARVTVRVYQPRKAGKQEVATLWEGEADMTRMNRLRWWVENRWPITAGHPENVRLGV